MRGAIVNATSSAVPTACAPEFVCVLLVSFAFGSSNEKVVRYMLGRNGATNARAGGLWVVLHIGAKSVFYVREAACVVCVAI